MLPIKIDSEAAVERNRTEWFDSQFAAHIHPVRTSCLDDTPFRVQMNISTVPNIAIVTGSTVSKISMDADKDALRNVPGHITLIGQFTEQASAFEFNGDVLPFDASSLFTYRTDMPNRMIAEAGSRYFGINISEDYLKKISPNFELEYFRRLRSNQNDLALLKLYAAHFLEAREHTPEAAYIISQHISDLIALAFSSSGDVRRLAEARGLTAARLAKAKTFIHSALFEPDLNDEKVARHLGVSPRYIRKLFEGDESGGCAAFIRNLRLDKARQMLASPLHIDKKIIEVALYCGFSDISNFNRLFRARFDMTPSDARTGLKLL